MTRRMAILVAVVGLMVMAFAGTVLTDNTTEDRILSNCEVVRRG
jgi:hypothetical protein